jgi:hypothetical protein
MTIARILGLRIPNKGALVGRVMREAMLNGRLPRFSVRTLQSPPDKNGLRTVLNFQQIGSTRYLDAAGFPGRTVGLREGASIANR